MERQTQEAKEITVEAIELSPEVGSVTSIQLSNRLFTSYLRQNLVSKVITPGQILTLSIYGQPQRFQLNIPITESLENLSLNEHSVSYLITKQTVFNFITSVKPEISEQISATPAVRIAGLSAQVSALREIADVALINPAIYAEFNISAPKGILLYGPPGTGKTLLCKYIAEQLQVPFISLSSSGVFSKFVGEAENKIHDIFEDARKRVPCIVFIDEIDALCPKREGSSEEYQRRVVTSLLTELDSTANNSRLLVLATTNRPNSIDEALRRPGRFDKEIEVAVPSDTSRREILKLLCEDMKKVNINEEEMDWLVGYTHGFVGADLTALCREAAISAINRYRTSGGEMIIIIEDFKHALLGVSPSALRDVVVEVPKVYWNDIGGYDDVKQSIRQAVEWPLKHPEAFKRLGISPPKGILLYGPPGCSKTLMAKAIATESSMNFIAIKGPELFSKYVGETERAIRDIFRKARLACPCVLFIDELDAMGTERDEQGVSERVLCTLLNEMDGVESVSDVTVLAATNRPERIDKALLRPGRFDRLIYIPPPDLQSRLKILQICTRKNPLHEDVNLDIISKNMHNFSGAEVTLAAREAGMLALTENIDATSIQQKHFLLAAGKIRPRITAEMLEHYQDFQNKVGLYT